MKTTQFWASIALAQITNAQRYPEPTPEVSDCEANLITTLCDYKKPELGTAVASSGKKMCWEYCNDNPPCNFVIFLAGNPYTGTGTCWLYPGEDFDESLGEPGCGADHLSVFDKPVCANQPTPTNGVVCEATASPSAVASICDYPPPDEQCWYDCAASSGASNCLSQCAGRENCAFAVFNALNENSSPYGSGNCWMYPNGTFDASKAGSCDGNGGKPNQFVYENKCPPGPWKHPYEEEESASGDENEDEGQFEQSAEGGDGQGDAAAEGAGIQDGKAEQATAKQGGEKVDVEVKGAASTVSFSVGALMVVGVAVLFY